jgi:hypothetical protein
MCGSGGVVDGISCFFIVFQCYLYELRFPSEYTLWHGVMTKPDIHRHSNHHHQILYHHHHCHCNAPEVYVCESCIE